MKSLDKEFEEFVKVRPRSWPKLIKRLRKQFDDFVEEQLFKEGYTDMKLGYLPLLMNIDPDGITNNELSRRACITKQGMSKIVNDLIELKYIVSEGDDKDKRSSIIRLTDKGKRFIVNSRIRIGILTDEYRDLLGKKNYEHLIDMMMKIMEYNEKKEMERGAR